MVQHEDPVRRLDRREPVSDGDAAPAPQQLLQPRPDQRLRLGVHARRRLVQREDGWIIEERARDGQQLALPLREILAALVYLLSEAVREGRDHAVRARGPEGAVDLLAPRRRARPDSQVVLHGAREEKHLLRDDADLAA